jgi:hypothetical protein
MVNHDMARTRTSGPKRWALRLGAATIVFAVLIALKPTGSSPPVSVPAAEPAPQPPEPAPQPPEPAPPPPEAPAKQHGPDAVVRAGDDLEAQVAAARPLATPVWSAPVELTFSSFKALRRTYRAARDFPPEEVARLHGAAASVRGALMPIDPVPTSGEMKRFWLANPVVVMAGCIFCFPPTLGDLVYVTTDEPLIVDRERLYRSVVYAKLLGRLELGPGKSEDGVEYLFSLKMREQLE